MHGLAVDDALGGEAHGGDVAGIDVHHRAVDGLGRQPRLVALADLVELDAELVGEQADRAAPDGGDDPGQEQHRRRVVRTDAEPEAGAGEVGVVVGAVVADLLHEDRARPGW